MARDSWENLRALPLQNIWCRGMNIRWQREDLVVFGTHTGAGGVANALHEYSYLMSPQTLPRKQESLWSVSYGRGD